MIADMPAPEPDLPPTPPGRDDERGIALLLVMMVLVLVIIVVTELMFASKVDMRTAKNEFDGFSLDYAIRGGFDCALALLQSDGNDGEHDGFNDKWARPDDYMKLDFGDTIVAIDIVDESRKYNLYWILKGNASEKRVAVARLTQIIDTMRDETDHDIAPHEAQDIAAQIANYVRVRREGKRKTYENRIILPPTTKNALMSLSELLAVVPEHVYYDQVTDEGEKLAGLERYITIWSDGKTNVNTAESCVLASFFGRDGPDKAKRIIDAREDIADPENASKFGRGSASTTTTQQPTGGGANPLAGALGGGATPGGKESFVGIKSLEELAKAGAIDNRDAQQLAPFLGTGSQVFSVFVTAKLNKITRRVRYVVRREKQQTYTLLRELRTDPRVDLDPEAIDPFAADEDDDADIAEMLGGGR